MSLQIRGLTSTMYIAHSGAHGTCCRRRRRHLSLPLSDNVDAWTHLLITLTNCIRSGNYTMSCIRLSFMCMKARRRRLYAVRATLMCMVWTPHMSAWHYTNGDIDWRRRERWAKITLNAKAGHVVALAIRLHTFNVFFYYSLLFFVYVCAVCCVSVEGGLAPNLWKRNMFSVRLK